MSKTKSIVLAAICAAVLILSSVLMIFSGYSGAEKTVANFINAVNSQNSEKMMKCFNDEDQLAYQLAGLLGVDDLTSLDYFELAGFSSDKLTVEKVEIIGMHSEQINDNNQTVTLFVNLNGTNENGDKEEIGEAVSYNCVRSSGEWKIDVINLLAS